MIGPFLSFILKLLFYSQIYTSEESNRHSGALVFLFGQLLSSIPFLFLISISSSLVFYFLIGLRDEFSLLMYFVLNFFMCLLVNEGLMLAVASLWQNIFWSVLTLVNIHVSFHYIYNNYFLLHLKLVVLNLSTFLELFSFPIFTFYLTFANFMTKMHDVSGGNDACSRLFQNPE